MDQKLVNSLNESLHSLRGAVDQLHRSVLSQDQWSLAVQDQSASSQRPGRFFTQDSPAPERTNNSNQDETFYTACDMSPQDLTFHTASPGFNQSCYSPFKSTPKSDQDLTFHTAPNYTPKRDEGMVRSYYTLVFPSDLDDPISASSPKVQRPSTKLAGCPRALCNKPKKSCELNKSCEKEHLVSLGKEQSMRIRQGDNIATATQSEMCSFSVDESSRERGNVTLDCHQTISLDANNNNEEELDRELDDAFGVNLDDSDERANYLMETIESRIAAAEEINYILDINHWDLDEPEPLNQTLLLGTLQNMEDDIDDNSPEYDNDEREALYWLKQKRDEFGRYVQMLKDL